MNPFHYVDGGSLEDSVRIVRGTPGAVFFAGGTTLVDLMKIDVLKPDILVDISRLPLATIEVDGAGLHIGANVRNSDLAWHPVVRQRYPVLAEAILAGATTQLRNMATTAGNIMQRTRCSYFRDTAAACNKRQPGSGCDAIRGFNRGHAVLGGSERCIATNPSDMCLALAILDAEVRTHRPDGSTRTLPFSALHLLPGATPERETVLEHGELITYIDIPELGFDSHYLKIRDRTSYEFALTSAAVALSVGDGIIREARLAIGGVATIPWRSRPAEQALLGKPANEASFRHASEVALADAVPQSHNAFKIELAKRTLVFALQQLLKRSF